MPFIVKSGNFKNFIELQKVENYFHEKSISQNSVMSRITGGIVGSYFLKDDVNQGINVNDNLHLAMKTIEELDVANSVNSVIHL